MGLQFLLVACMVSGFSGLGRAVALESARVVALSVSQYPASLYVRDCHALLYPKGPSTQ